MYQALVRLFYIICLLLSEFHNYMFMIKSLLGGGEETLKGSTAKALNLILLIIINTKTVHSCLPNPVGVHLYMYT